MYRQQQGRDSNSAHLFAVASRRRESFVTQPPLLILANEKNPGGSNQTVATPMSSCQNSAHNQRNVALIGHLDGEEAHN